MPTPHIRAYASVRLKQVALIRFVLAVVGSLPGSVCSHWHGKPGIGKPVCLLQAHAGQKTVVRTAVPRADEWSCGEPAVGVHCVLAVVRAGLACW